LDGFDANLKLIYIIEGIEDTENIHSVLLGLVNKVINGVVRKGRVRNTVGTTEQHLERNVRNKLSHLAESVPRILVEESHSDIKGGTTPALKGVQVRESVAGLLGNAEQINGTDTSSQKRLMGISPSCVHEKSTLVLADSLGKSLGALLKDDVSPSFSAGLRNIDFLSSRVDELGDLNLALEFGLADLAFDAAAVDGNVTEIGK
jgi:hypothetical protein